MIMHIPDDMSVRVLARFAADNGYEIRARWDGELSLLMIPLQIMTHETEAKTPASDVMERLRVPLPPDQAPIGPVDEKPIWPRLIMARSGCVEGERWVDSAGEVFDPARHSTTKDGVPGVRQNGTFRARRGAGQGPDIIPEENSTPASAQSAPQSPHGLSEVELIEAMRSAKSPDDLIPIRLAMGDVAVFPVGSVERNRLLDEFSTMKRRLGI